jgi:hypothetical protein
VVPVDFALVLLDIPQGAITVASAILVVFVGALLTLTIWIFRLLYSIQGRLTSLETKLGPYDERWLSTTDARTEILWGWYRERAPYLQTMNPPENPMKQERWNELANKLHKDELTDEEAEELLSALLKREEQALQEKDTAALAILGPGIILTKWQLKERELREQFAEVVDNRNK